LLPLSLLKKFNFNDEELYLNLVIQNILAKRRFEIYKISKHGVEALAFI